MNDADSVKIRQRDSFSNSESIRDGLAKAEGSFLSQIKDRWIAMAVFKSEASIDWLPKAG